MNNAARFSDKMAIVTGAASGIGRATLLRLVGEGATVLASDINTSGLGESLELAKAAADHGGSATSCVVSVTDEAAVRRCVADFVAEYGKLDVLINMAGVLQSSHTTETSLADFMAIVEVNLGGTFLFCREALPHLLQTRGNIVNCASTSAYFGHPCMAAYSASKGGIAAMTHALAWEYIKRGVRVNAVAPGGIDTPLVQATPIGLPKDMDYSLLVHLTPINGYGKPENVASVVAMLASADGAHVNGEIIRIDAGVHS